MHAATRPSSAPSWPKSWKSSASLGTSEVGGRALDLHLTQTDLANMVGGSRQSVNQVLNSFERLGYVDLDGRRILIRKPELLQRCAGQSA